MEEYIYSQSVHKDFHGVMSYLIRFLRDNHGEDNMEKFFRDAAVNIYKPLIERINKNGLQEIGKHFQKVFDMEKGKIDLESGSEDEIVLKIERCPAIWHMKDTNTDIDRDFCRCSTELVNDSIAGKCGLRFSVDYDQDNGKCIQRFWRE